jgi:hypothetical protein
LAEHLKSEAYLGFSTKTVRENQHVGM